MTLPAGSRFGPYEILSPLGAGGMGEVYRARDFKLERDIALKLLPPEFSRDTDRLLRFEREARVLASLNHPGIAAIYGLEESNGSRFLVLELAPGETLAERIATGPMPVEEALDICRQISEALEVAHEKGIIHRDLKPANVKNGQWIAVTALEDGVCQLFRMPAAGGAMQQLTTGYERMRHPFYSPDGRWIYIQPSHRNIFRVPAEGGSLEQVTYFPEAGLFLEEPTLSPDGRYLYYCRGNGGSSLWLLKLEPEDLENAGARKTS